MSKTGPINPWNLSLDLNLDYESTGLLFKHYFSNKYENGKLVLPSLEDSLEAAKFIDVLQIGYKKSGRKTTQHVQLDDLYSTIEEPITPLRAHRPTTVKVAGNNLQAFEAPVATHELDDIFNFLSKYKGKGLNSKKVNFYMQSVAPKMYAKGIKNHYVAQLLNGNIIQAMDWSLKNLLEPKTEDILKKIGKYKGIKKTVMPMNVFYNSQEKDSIYSILDDLLKGATSKKPKTLGGWNAPFELSITRSILLRSGQKDLFDRFNSAISSGAIKVESVEREWQLIAYKLMNENPQLADSFKVGYSPIAFAETAGRSGQVAKTLDDFRHSITWKEDSVARYFNWHKAVKEVMEVSSGEAHLGGPDVKLTDALTKAFNDVKSKAHEIMRVKGINVASFEEFATSHTGENIIEQAIAAVMQEQVSNITGTEASHLVGVFKHSIAADAKNLAKYNDRMFGSYMAAKTSSGTISTISKKYGGVAIATAALLAMTYGGTGDKGYSLENGGLDLKGRKKSFSKGKYVEGAISGDPYTKSQFFSKVLPGATLAFSGLYGTGLITAYKKGMLGRDFRRPQNIFDMTRQAIRTAYIGAKQIESSVPLARVFRASALKEYFFGSKNFGEHINRAGDVVERAHEFKLAQKTLENGKISLWAERHDIHELLEAAEVTNPTEAAHMRDYLALKNTPDKFNGRTMRIIKTKAGTKVMFVDDIDAAKQIKSKEFLLDLDVQVFRAKQPSFNKGRNAIENTIAINKASYELSKTKLYEKMNFEDYIKGQRTIPQWATSGSGKKTWEGFEWLKWKLDIIPKGVGQGTWGARPGLGERITKLEDYVSVRKFTKDPLSPRSLKYAFNYVRHPIEEMSMHAMNRFLETPLETLYLGNITKKWATQLKEMNNPIAHFAGGALRFLNRAHLGLDTSKMKYGLPQYMGEFAAKRLLPGWLAWEGFRAVDHLLGALTFSKTGRGPFTTVPIKAWEYAHMAYAKFSDWTGLTSTAKKQNQIAPGSSGIGIFAFPASLYGFSAVAEKLYKSGPQAIRDDMDKIGRKLASTQLVKNALKSELYPGAVKTPIQRFLGWSIRNPKLAFLAAGMVPMVPFLPGFIGSDKSYQEVKAEYKGERDVAVRKYRGWLMSSSAYEGGKPNQFRRHALNLVMSDWENKGVIWPSYFKRFMHNATLGLYGRYMLEEYHKEDQPVYTSAPYGASIPLIGPLIAATIGRVIKPTVQYHNPKEGLYVTGRDKGETGTPHDLQIADTVTNYTGSTTSVVEGIGLSLNELGSTKVAASDFTSSFEEFAGFRGFMFRTFRQYMSGRSSLDQYVPYAQSAKQFYNPANEMWAYSLGDITGVGGEFLRRILQNPEKRWEVNQIQNSLFGTSWIPHEEKYKDFWHGTTFDKVPMGWLYATQKGWEHLYPGLRGADLDQYPAQVRTEILKQLAPSSREFNAAAQQTMALALGNELSPHAEQRYYETLDQVRQLKSQLYAHASNYAYRLDTDEAEGTLSGFNEDEGIFTIEEYGDKPFRLAGVSTREEDIRNKLLQKYTYDTTEELNADAQEIRERMLDAIRGHMRIGEKISFDIPEVGQFTGYGKPTEAIVGGLNEDLLDMGSPFTNTGNLSMHNIAQDKAGLYSRAMAKYWDTLTEPNTFWNKKLISDRDYLQQYLAAQYFNKEVKLWSKPLEHILEPMIASTLAHVGIDIQPSFTKDRRMQQQYWDVIKYVKYRMLEASASNKEEADYYNDMWRKTMVGADPTDGNSYDEYESLPLNEKSYFDFFASEPDPSKRGKIYKYLPAPAKRLYKGIWAQQLAESSDDEEVISAYSRLREAEGWEFSEEDEEQYQSETGGQISKGDWARANFVQQYMEEHALPGLEWSGWSPDVSVENTELLSLRDQGEQIQDYGYFDAKARMAAYDTAAADASIELNSTRGMSAEDIGTMVDMLVQDDNVSNAVSMPTTSSKPIINKVIETNGHDKMVRQQNDKHTSLLNSFFL